MKTREENGILVLCLEGRIDTNNAGEVEHGIFEALERRNDSMEHIVLDAKNLEYISSAGLRVLMKLRKKMEEPLRIEEVSREVYEIFETTGFTELFDVRKRLREISTEGLEVIGRGFYGTVYRIDADTIVKVYQSPDSISMIEHEKKMAKTAFVSGIPTAISYDIVRVGNRFGSVFELLEAKTFNDRIIEEPEKAEEIVKEYVTFLKRIHGTEFKPGAVPEAKKIFLGYLDVIREYLTEEQFLRLGELFRVLPENHHAVHGDFQMKNVMLVEGAPLLIDMDTLSCGDPVFDLQALYVTYQEFGEDDPENSRTFLGISKEMAEFIWKKVLGEYAGTTDRAVLEAFSDRIRTVAAVRFLYLLAVTDLKEGTLGKARIRHTKEHINDLLGRVERLDLDV